MQESICFLYKSIVFHTLALQICGFVIPFNEGTKVTNWQLREKEIQLGPMTSYYFSLFFYLFILSNFIYLFIFGCVGSSLLHAGFLQLWRAGATLHCSARASHCGGFSCCRAWALGVWASVVVARGLSSCGARAQLLRGMWDLPGPGLEPLSPALSGRFLTTALPGKSHYFSLYLQCFNFKE